MAEVYGGKGEAEEILLETGGAGTNVAVGLARLGMTTATVACVGEDWVKERVVERLKLEGVETSLLQTVLGVKSGMSVILVAPDGGRSILTYRGASSELKGKLVDWKKVAGADWLHLASLGGEMALAEDMISFAVKNGVRVSWNPGKRELAQKERLLRLLSKVSLLVLNRMEAAQLLGHDYEQMKGMARKLGETRVKMAAITDGKKGAAVGSQTGFLTAPAFKLKSVDDTGAGDAFCAGMIAGLLEERPLKECLTMGLANGVSVVTALGAKEKLLREKEMKKWLRRRVKFLEEVW